MILSIGPIADRGAPPLTRRCDGCLQTGRELRQCRVHEKYFVDICSRCIDRLKRMPRLPAEKNATAWGRALSHLRGSYSASAGEGRPMGGGRP